MFISSQRLQPSLTSVLTSKTYILYLFDKFCHHLQKLRLLQLKWSKMEREKMIPRSFLPSSAHIHKCTHTHIHMHAHMHAHTPYIHTNTFTHTHTMTIITCKCSKCNVDSNVANQCLGSHLYIKYWIHCWYWLQISSPYSHLSCHNISWTKLIQKWSLILPWLE